MLRDRIKRDYFEWLHGIVCKNRYCGRASFRTLLSLLHDTEFYYVNPRDNNRAEDGMDLRYRFAYDYQGIENAERYLTGPCSVLEMMIALAIRCEEDFMDDPRYGNRTAQWFWGMIVSLGLGGLTDSAFDEQYVNGVLDAFLERKYAPNGRGGLFTIRDCKRDLRKAEIWHQMCWYLDTIV
jgi:hypothetical protein